MMFGKVSMMIRDW